MPNGIEGHFIAKAGHEMDTIFNLNGGTEAYAYTINASFDEIEEFYKIELRELGWDFDDTIYASGKHKLLWVFVKDTDPLNVFVSPDESDGTMLVYLIK